MKQVGNQFNITSVYQCEWIASKIVTIMEEYFDQSMIHLRRQLTLNMCSSVCS